MEGVTDGRTNPVQHRLLGRLVGRRFVSLAGDAGHYFVGFDTMMTPERWAEIQKIASGLGRHGLLVGIIHELIAEVERLTADNERLTAALRQAQNESAELNQEANRLALIVLLSSDATAELESLKADNERLRAELAERERQIVALGRCGNDLAR